MACCNTIGKRTPPSLLKYYIGVISKSIHTKCVIISSTSCNTASTEESGNDVSLEDKTEVDHTTVGQNTLSQPTLKKNSSSKNVAFFFW